METERILSIDATSPIVRAVLTQGSGSEIEVEEAIAVDASAWWKSQFQNPKALNSSYDEEDESGEDKPSSSETATPETNGAPVSNGNGKFPIADILSQLPEESFDEALIVLPPHQAVALHLELPFSQKSSLARIAPLEAQDKLPFNVDDFHCSARALRKLESNLFDVQVDLYPDHLLSQLISTCKEFKFEPSIVTIPSGLGELCHSLYPKYISGNSLLVFRTSLDYSCTALIDGVPVSYFSIPLEGESDHQFPGESSLNIWIASLEERFPQMIERVYFVGERSQFDVWKRENIIRATEDLEFEDLLPNCSSELGLSALGAAALSKEVGGAISPNYRSGKYLFRPHVRNALEGLRPLAIPFMLVLAAFIAVMPIRYYSRAHRINSLESELNSLINQALPGQNISRGSELSALKAKLQQSKTMLQQLGTSTTIEPQKELALLLETLGEFDSLKLRRLNILQGRTSVEGTATSYKDAEAIEIAFKQLQDRYCDVKLDTSGRAVAGQQSFDLSLKKDCE